MKTSIPTSIGSLLAAAVCVAGLGGCGAYYVGGPWRPGPAVVVAPEPYAYQYYYDASVGAYYCYYPRYGWRFCPSPPPAGAVFWQGAPPAYLPPPPPGFVVAGSPGFTARFFFDPDRHAYYYYDNDRRWHYYPGRPPANAHFWRGQAPRELPHPPRGAPRWQGRAWRDQQGNRGHGRNDRGDHGDH